MKTVTVSHQGPVALITIDRPDVLNALGTAAAAELLAAADSLRENTDVRAVVVTGAGTRAFSAGADIAEFASLAGPDAFLGFIQVLENAVSAIAELPQPVLAAVEGVALGGGCELAMACDLRVAGERARFGLPEVKLGLLPGLGGTQRSIRLLPPAVATRMLLTGEAITAAEAHQHGLCETPVPAGTALEAAMALASKLAAGPPLAMGAAKRLTRVGAEVPLSDAIIMEQQVAWQLFGTVDGREGVAAFLAKRPATFVGR